MGLKRHVLALAAAAGLAATGLAVATPHQVLAGYGPSQNCNDNGDDVAILGGPASKVPNAPITLGVELGAISPYNYSPGYVAVCFSNSPYGCNFDFGSTAQPYCVGNAAPSHTITPATPPASGETVTVTIPFTLCFGSNLTGQPCANGPANLGTTGVIVAAISTGPPQGTDKGATLALNQGTLWLAGVPIPFGGPTVVAGVGSQSVTAHTNNSTPICVLNGYCPNVPTGAAAAFTGTQSVYSISVNGIGSTYSPGYYCIVDTPGSAPC
jgi:hypothetical protein